MPIALETAEKSAIEPGYLVTRQQICLGRRSEARRTAPWTSRFGVDRIAADEVDFSAVSPTCSTIGAPRLASGAARSSVIETSSRTGTVAVRRPASPRRHTVFGPQPRSRIEGPPAQDSDGAKGRCPRPSRRRAAAAAQRPRTRWPCPTGHGAERALALQAQEDRGARDRAPFCCDPRPPANSRAR